MKNMTEIKWNGEDLRRNFPQSKTLGELVEVTSKQARERGEFVCAITVNGLSINEEQEARFDSTLVDEISEFSIKIQSLSVLLDQSIEECSIFLGQLIKSIETAAEIFRTEDLTRAHQFYKTCIEGTQLFVEMLTHYKVAYQKGFGPVPESWGHFETKLTLALRQILEAYRQKNYILVSDLLEYEICQVLSDWQKELIDDPKVVSTESADC